MWVKDVSLIHFRNYESCRVDLDNGINVIIGDNAQGKTNFLEAIYFCVKGKSFRNNLEADLIHFSKDVGYIGMHVSSDGIEEKIEVKLQRHEKKIIRVNEEIIGRIQELRKEFPLVLFTPDDLKIIKEMPQLRRNMMDKTIAELFPNYRHILLSYNKSLNGRNKLLKNGCYGKYFQEELRAFTNRLCQDAYILTKMRYSYVQRLAKLAHAIHLELTDGKEVLELSYHPNLNAAWEQMGETENFVSNCYQEIMSQLDRDRQVRHTTKGAHKDDVDICVNGMNLKRYGSQGQQRTAILSIRLAEVDLLNYYNEDAPLVLFDDVFSELDEKRRSYILNRVKDFQTIITTTDADFLRFRRLDRLVRIHQGRVMTMEPKVSGRRSVRE